MSDLFAIKVPVVEQIFDRLAEEVNYRLMGERNLAPTWKGRAEDNVVAVKLMAQIEEQRRPATPIEQDYLARFIGFGASDLANAVFPPRGKPCRAGWEQIVSDLTDATSLAEWNSLSRSTQYAHFTPEFVIRAVWRAVHRLGFRGGSVLEPGCGTGLFLAMMPEEMISSSVLTGIDVDPITARIARLLFPRADIRCTDFTDPELQLAPQCLAIGNPPFSDRVVRGAGLKSTGLSLHEYFVHRSVEALRPGGIAAFVVSRFLMDKETSGCRDVLGDLADFMGAVRLPAGALHAAAGTDVVVDLIFLRRRDEADGFGGHPWATLRQVDGPDGAALSVNRYWTEHPEMVLGEHAMGSGQYGHAYTCKPLPDRDLVQMLSAAVELIGQDDGDEAYIPEPVVHKEPEVVHKPPQPMQPPISVRVGRAADGATIKEGSYFVGPDTELYQVVQAVPKRIQIKTGRGTEGIFASHAAIIRGLIPVRDAVREVLRAQEADRPWEAAQARLETAYAAFTRRHGPINKLVVSKSEPDEDGDVVERSRRPNIAPMKDDPDCWLVTAIEEYDVSTGKGTRGPIFTQRVISPPPDRVINSPADALAVVLNEAGEVDVDRVAEILGTDRHTAIAGLGDAIYYDPIGNRWETDDEYLSGHVRAKLQQAQAAASVVPELQRNVTALEAVQPIDLKPSEITARIGAPWIGAEDVTAFIQEAMGFAAPVNHVPEIASWSVDMQAFKGAAATSEWGTAKRHAGELLADALNNRVPQVYNYEVVRGVTIATLDPSATEAAKEKLAKIKTAFGKWVWADHDRTARLARVYNDLFNNLVPRRFTGAHLMLPGASTAIKLRPHQTRVAWRIVSAGSSYVAHQVGAGKTFAIAASVMEQRRLGLVNKVMIAVPGHCLAQFSREFVQLYPNARILVADETNFSKAKRSRFLARAATGIWDAIIITHSAFKFISVPVAFERELMEEQVENYEDMLNRVNPDDRIGRKRVERLKEGLLAKLKALRTRKDDMLTLAEIGIDQIVVDESQEFRKLSFATNMAGLRGIDPNGSQRAWDLFVKARYIQQEQPRRPLVLSSGTPITNTMGEMYTLLRFMAPDALEGRGLSEFDAWALTFGDTRTELELQPSGLYKPVTRFSEFVNVPELISMFRSVADVVQQADLREFVRLPAVQTGQRQVITSPGSDRFKEYQRHLASRIKAIEKRKGQPKKGDDILLSVIMDGRHAAIDMRLVGYEEDEPGNKLNALIANVHAIWLETADLEYAQPGGKPYAAKGAAQMIFSDLGTLSVEDNRGFSAYRWIKERLIALGVPSDQIAFMQQHKQAAAKQRLFDAVNSGLVRVLIGSSETMGTGVNCQQRLIALHHLDVPWLPSWIAQREGRIERQGNQNAEIRLFAYATLGSMDAQMWQTNERKARFIAAVLGGDRSIRRMEDLEGSASSQFAMAKAIASGDARLMQKAGLEADIARLMRQRDAHEDDQHHSENQVRNARYTIEKSEYAIPLIEADLLQWEDTSGDRFALTYAGEVQTERKEAGRLLLSHMRRMEVRQQKVDEEVIGKFAGFDLVADGILLAPRFESENPRYEAHLSLMRNAGAQSIQIEENMSGLGLIARLERMGDRIDGELERHQQALKAAKARLADYLPRLGGEFAMQADLNAKLEELERLDAELAKTVLV